MGRWLRRSCISSKSRNIRLNIQMFWSFEQARRISGCRLEPRGGLPGAERPSKPLPTVAVEVAERQRWVECLQGLWSVEATTTGAEGGALKETAPPLCQVPQAEMRQCVAVDKHEVIPAHVSLRQEHCFEFVTSLGCLSSIRISRNA